MRFDRAFVICIVIFAATCAVLLFVFNSGVR